MKFIILLSILFIVIFTNTTGQCLVRGKITDKNGEIPIGVLVYLKSNKSIGAVTDITGNFSLKLNENTPQILVISYIGYYSIEDTVKCVNGSTIVNNYVLEPAVTEIKEVNVSAKARKGNDAQLEAIKKISSSSIDFITSETIKKTGDANVASAIARVTGVSTNSGGLITVRGAGDRYIKTTINGSRIPTLDPFTNNIKLDIFPASLIDNVTITKTAQPDLPGDWAGAYLSIDTKEYPDKLSVFLETSFGYNNQTTFNDVVSTERSSTDWLGYDNSLREHDHSSFVAFTENPTYYQEFVALGLADYLNSLGITDQKTFDAAGAYKLGLTELKDESGNPLLGKAQLNDPLAIDNATSKYNSEFKDRAYAIINEDAIKSAETFPNNWKAVKRKAPLNFTQSISIGNQINLFGHPFGYLLGFRYSNIIQYDPDSKANKALSEGIYADTNGFIPPHDSIFQKSAKQTNGWSGLINLAYKFNSNNNVSFMFMPNVIGVNNVRDAVIYPGNGPESSEYLIETTGNTIQQFYESRRQMVYQLNTEHYLPLPKIKIDFNVSYTDGSSSAPDFKNANYPPLNAPIQNRPYFIGQSNTGAGRIYRYLDQNILDSRLSAELPLGDKPGFVRKFKIGGAYQIENRNRVQYFYQLFSGNGDYSGVTPVMALHPQADPYGLDRFEIDSVYKIVQQYYGEQDYPSNNILGKSTVKAGYAMIDYSLFQAIRFSGGLRVEQSYMYTDCNVFYNYNLAPEDERRRFEGGPDIGKIFVKPGELQNLSFLPSANLIIKLKKDESAPVNLRFNYSQTIGRPSLQELSDIVFYDYELRSIVRGNSDLKMVQIKNYDFRLEAFFRSGDNISLSIFYKDIKNHIDLINMGAKSGYSFANSADNSWIKGIEIEGKKQIGNFLEFRTNVTLVNSYSKPSSISIDQEGNRIIYPNPDGKSYTLLGQAPYIVNTMLTYTSKKLGLTANINYNIQGPRLVINGNVQMPLNIYELPRHMVDLKIIKSIGKRVSVSLKINDALASVKFWEFDNLNTDVVRAYKVGTEYPLDYDRYAWGTYYVLALSYKI